MKTKILFLFIFLFFCLLGQSQIKVASVLGDNMVLQRNAGVKIWGKAKPGEKTKREGKLGLRASLCYLQ